MAQYARPNSDVYNDGPAIWTTAPLYQKVDEVVASDADFITTDLSFPAAISGPVTLGLSTVVDPGVDTGHVLRFRARVSAGAVDTDALLITDGSNSTLVNLGAQSLTGSFQTITVNLSEAQAALLDGYYNNLGVSYAPVVGFGGSATIEISWIELEVPEYVDPSPSDLALDSSVSWRQIGATWTDNAPDEDHQDIYRDDEKIDEVDADVEEYVDDDDDLAPTIDPDDSAPTPPTFCYIIKAIAADGSEIGESDEVCGTPAQAVFNDVNALVEPSDLPYDRVEETGVDYTALSEGNTPSYTALSEGNTPTYTPVTE